MSPSARISRHDRDVLRRLAAEQAEIAALSVQPRTIAGWQRVNDLQPGRAMVWINEIPWHEMDVHGELALACEDPFLRTQEETLRQTLYQWRHMPADMVVEPVFYSPLAVSDTGYGIDEDVDIVRTDERNTVVSRRFHRQIREPRDVDRIRTPIVRHDAAASEAYRARLEAAFGDLLPVVPRGAPGFWFSPWDLLIRLWGVEDAMLDLALRPELVHLAMERLVTAMLARLDQYEDQGLLSSNNGNVRVGSGGLGYTSDLPPAEAPGPVGTGSLWGCATAQIFSAVSPAMHEEFALQYERRWLERFGLNYYGCCEPLHLKLGLLRSVPRLRKVSMSPLADLASAAAQTGRDLVLSIKPNPAILAGDVWRPEVARQELRDLLRQASGCVTEVIMKDVSTVRYAPQRLWEWARIASEVADEAAREAA
jgi:hypothetical protein